MKRALLAAAAALSLTLGGCLGAGAGTVPGSPAALAQTTVADEQALTLAARAVDSAALAARALVKTGVITPGSPLALSLARRLDQARDLVNAAAAARTALSYGAALDQLTALLTEIQTDIQSALQGAR